MPPPVLELRLKNSSLGHFINGQFTIDQVEASDQGMYECVPSNIIGVGTTAKLNLTVLGKYGGRQKIQFALLLLFSTILYSPYRNGIEKNHVRDF